MKTIPEGLISPCYEIVYLYALLFHPGEITEVKNTITTALSQYLCVLCVDTPEMLFQSFSGIASSEFPSVAQFGESVTFAAVKF